MSTAELLEIPEVRERLSPVSVEEYHKYPLRNERGRRTELVRGIVIEKMSKSPRHSWLTYELHKLITQALGEKFMVWMDQPLTFIDSEPEPDIAVVAGTSKQYLDEHPHTALLVIEIAVTSIRLDRVKAEIYAEAGIPEYWIVNTSTKQVEVYTEIHGGKYISKHTFDVDVVLRSQSLPEFKLQIRDLFPE